MTRHACPDCRCYTPEDDAPVQPATSNGAHRRVLIQGVKQVIDSKKRARSEKPAGEV